MNLTLRTLMPAIVVGGAVLGLLAAGEVNTRMKAAPEPSWRMMARDKATNVVSYAFVDSGPSDLSPYLPWIGGGRNGNVAVFPEDPRRSRAMSLPIDFADVEADLALAEAAIRPWTSDLGNPAVRAAQIAADLRRDYTATSASGAPVGARPEADRSVAPGHRALPMLAQPIKFVEPAPLDIPIPAPVDEGAQVQAERLTS
jgi:hypothetical protein